MLNTGMLSSKRSDWNTPLNVLELVREVAPIGLDPCGNGDSVVDAEVTLDGTTDGLASTWQCHGLVYMNPPYGRTIGSWVAKCAYEANCGAEIIALLPARTDARWFRNVWTADRVCFWYGRLKFLGAPSSAPFPSAIAYWGERGKRFDRVFGDHGRVVRP